MASRFRARLINGPFGDPGVYVDHAFEKRAMLLDLGDLAPLSARSLLRVTHVFVSHTHMDHFIGFDRLLRICLGRDRSLSLFGPPGFVDRVEHKLGAYTWNLVRHYSEGIELDVGEPSPDGLTSSSFVCSDGFQRSPPKCQPALDGVILDEANLRIRYTVLDHHIPCLAFAVEEKTHVNVWKNRVLEMGFQVGPWLTDLKRAVLDHTPPDTPFRIQWRDAGRVTEVTRPLGELATHLIRTTPGQKICYVTDAVYSAENVTRIVQLAQDADVLFIEAPFLDSEAALAVRKRHLTARQAGELGRRASVKRLVPFHFSPRYAERPDALRNEVTAAFEGGA